jgi:excinuclease ABC subunit A
VKLAAELGQGSSLHTLYVLDEPTTGLHFDDVRRLVAVLGRLADAGHSLVVIEHHLDVIKCADWIVDLGPEGGDRGGTLVAEGTPEEVAATKGSFTGAYLAPMLARSGRKPVRKVGEPETKPGKKPAPKPAPKPSKPAKPPAKKAPARTKAAR